MQFSVVITCHNQREYIRAAVDSVLSQKHPGTEVIVVDDGSADGSREALEEYGGAIRLTGFVTSRGAIEARNHGASLATGEYIVFLDGDDLFTPWALDVYEQIIAERHPKVAVGCATFFRGDVPPIVRLDERPPCIQFMDYPTLMAKDRSVWLSASVLVVERQTFTNVGGWTPGIFHMDLYDLAAKLGEVGRTVCVTSPSTTLYRMHPGNSRHNIEAFTQAALLIIRKERNGEYAKRSNHPWQRRAWFGGVAAFWSRKAAAAGLYGRAAALSALGAVMILTALARRAAIRLMRRRAVSTVAWPDG